jgi:hypothetical protein
LSMSKTPWAYRQNSDNPVDGFIIESADGAEVGMVEREDDAVVIVVAVNNILRWLDRESQSRGRRQGAIDHPTDREVRT